MNIINLRKNVRRVSDTRPNLDRRGSAGNSTENFHLGSRTNESVMAKLNRRKAERRSKDRRRPTSEMHDNTPSATNPKYARIKLTRGERNLIQDMFLSDLNE